MSVTKVEEPAVDDYIYVYLKHGWVQIKIEAEGVMINVFDHADENISTQTIWNEDLEPDEEVMQ